MNDAQGDGGLVRTSVAAFYSYNLKVSSHIDIWCGVKGAYYQEKLNWDKFIFASQIDPTTGNVNPGSGEPPPSKDNITAVDFAAGAIMSHTDKFFVGLPVDHLTQPTLSFYDNTASKLPMKITLNAGAMINATSGGLGNAGGGDIMIQQNIL